MPKIKVNDINLYYEIHGQGDPLVLISGLSADHNLWLPVLDELTKRYQIVIFDNRGVGQSDCPDYPYTIEMLADDTAALVKALGIDTKIHFIGSSMGGAIAQQLASKYPEMVRSITIENSSYVIESARLKIYRESRTNLMKNNAYSADAYRMVLAILYSEKFLSGPGVIEAMIEKFFANPYPTSTQGYVNQLSACMSFNSLSWLKHIKAPSLVITGDEDLLLPKKYAQEMAKLIPNAEYYCFKEVGHIPHVEQPKGFLDLVLKFLAKH